MQLLNPLALWLLALLIVPPLMTRKRTPTARVSVSNLYLWRLALAPSTHGLAFRRVRRSWLVALQMAVIAAGVLALSEPVVTFGGGLTTLIFDVSASMAATGDGSTRFEIARQRALALLRTLQSTSTVRLVAAADPPRTLGDFAAADPLLYRAIEALEPTAGAADLSGAIAIAAGRGDTQTIFVFSDVAAPATGQPQGSPTTNWVSVGRVADNAAVTRIAARPVLLGGPAGQVLVVVQNFATRPRSVDVEISVDNRVADLVHADLPATGRQTLLVDLANLGHVVTARLKGDDALPVDDVRWAAVPLANPIRVALFGPRGSFLEKALAANPSVSLATYDLASTGAIATGTAMSDTDVLVCDGCTRMPAAAIPMLVVTPPGQNSVTGLVTRASNTHPVVASLELDRQTAAAASTGLDRRAEVILRAGGIPAVTASEEDGVRRVDVHIDLAREDFVLSTAFPVLIANALEWLSAERQIPEEIVAGQPLTINHPAGQETNQIQVIGPDERPRDVQRVGTRSVVAGTDTAGVYRVTMNGSEHLVVINPVIDGESNLAAASGTPRLPARGELPAASGEPFALAGWLALLALSLVAVEWRLRVVSTP